MVNEDQFYSFLTTGCCRQALKCFLKIQHYSEIRKLWMTVNQKATKIFYVLWTSHKSSPQTCLDDIKSMAHLSKGGPNTFEPCNDVLGAHISFDYEHCSFNSLTWLRKHQQMCMFQNRFNTKCCVVYCSLANLVLVLDWNFKCNFRQYLKMPFLTT